MACFGCLCEMERLGDEVSRLQQQLELSRAGEQELHGLLTRNEDVFEETKQRMTADFQARLDSVRVGVCRVCRCFFPCVHAVEDESIFVRVGPQLRAQSDANLQDWMEERRQLTFAHQQQVDHRASVRRIAL